MEASIEALRQALLAEERIAAAILFGSAAKGTARPSSDLDVGVVAGSARDAAELEAAYLDLAGRLSGAARRDVHLFDRRIPPPHAHRGAGAPPRRAPWLTATSYCASPRP